MKDATTGEPLTVLTDGGAGPYMFVPVDQLVKVTTLLDDNKIAYWVDEEVISIDGDPEDAVINFGMESDPAAIQHLLDCIL